MDQIAQLLQNAGGSIGYDDLRQLNDALRKAADIGYQTPAVTTGGVTGSLSPLVPQSIEGVLSSTTFEESDIVLWPRMPKTLAGQTVHEYPVVTSRGRRQTPFVAEGSSGVNNGSTYNRGSVQIKFMLEKRELTDVATMTGLIGVNPSALANESEQGTMALMEKIEIAMFHADSAVEPLAFNGLIKQIRAGGNVTDLAGSSATLDLLEWILGELGSAPYYGHPDTIYVEPRVFRDLSRQGNSTIRTGANGGDRTSGTGGLKAIGPRGAVPIVAAPFLFTADAPDAAASAASGAPATPTIAQQPTDNGAGTSLWLAGDAGNYIYKLVAVGAGGYSAPVTCTVVAVIAGSQITITVDNTPADVVFYRVYRSDKGGVASTCTFIANVVANNNGTTTITDLNAARTKCSSILFVKHDPTIMEFARLLDLIRRPIPSVNLTQAFALLLFGAPIVKVPSKCWLVSNVGVSAAITL
jgi:hypothetical protein